MRKVLADMHVPPAWRRWLSRAAVALVIALVVAWVPWRASAGDRIERLRAGVDIVGISNFVTFLENTQAYRRDLRRAEYGDERKADMRKLLTRISPTENADKIESALFVAHGANDPRVPVGETEQIARAVRKNGHDVWYMLAKNEGHGFRKQENRDLFYRLTVLFLEKHLQ